MDEVSLPPADAPRVPDEIGSGNPTVTLPPLTSPLGEAKPPTPPRPNSRPPSTNAPVRASTLAALLTSPCTPADTPTGRPPAVAPAAAVPVSDADHPSSPLYPTFSDIPPPTAKPNALAPTRMPPETVISPSGSENRRGLLIAYTYRLVCRLARPRGS